VALGEIGDEQSVAPITWCLKDESSHVRNTAKNTLKYKFNFIKRPRVRHKTRKISDICPNCSNPVEPNTNYCPTCGFSLNQKIGVCPKCSNPVLPNTNFCTICGAHLKKRN